MKSKFVVFIALSFLFLVSINAQTVAVNPSPPTIQVTGTAEVQVVPDEVTFLLRVTKSDKSLQVAKTQNDANIAQIIALTKRFAIDAKDVRTDFISVSEKYDRVKTPDDEDEYKNVFAGYAVSKTIVVKLRDLSKFENFFSEIVKIGVSQVSNVSFQSSQIRKHKDQARAMAIRAAREKAEAMTKELGQGIGKAVSIEEEDIDDNRISNANITSNSISTGLLYDVSGSSETIAPGTITIRAQVEVSFLLY